MKNESDEKNTKTRQRQDSVPVSNVIAREINTPLLFPIQWARRRSAAAYVVVSDPLEALSILRRLLCFRCCSLCAHLPPPTPPSSSYISRACFLFPAASVVVSDPSYVSYIPRPLPTPPLSSLSSRAYITLLTPPSLSSIP